MDTLMQNWYCMEEVGYYSTGPYLMHTSDKVYYILTQVKGVINGVFNEYVVYTSWLMTKMKTNKC